MHLFFALRYSVMVSAFYRSGDVTNLLDESTGAILRDQRGNPLHVDVSGVGARLGLAIGL